MKTSFNVFCFPNGEIVEMPDEIFNSTKFNKRGYPKKNSDSTLFYEWYYKQIELNKQAA